MASASDQRAHRVGSDRRCTRELPDEKRTLAPLRTISRMLSTETALLTATQVRFSATIAPARVSAAYRAGLLITAIAMMLLPLLYVLLVGATSAAVWMHVTRNTWLLADGVTQWRLLAYATPAIAGVVLVFFMVKPIFARPARRQDA